MNHVMTSTAMAYFPSFKQIPTKFKPNSKLWEKLTDIAFRILRLFVHILLGLSSRMAQDLVKSQVDNMVARKLLPPYSRPYSPHNESQLPPSPPPHPNVIPLNVHKEHWKNSTPKIPFRHQPEQMANTPQTQHPQGEIFEEVVFNSKNDSIKLYFMCPKMEAAVKRGY